MSETLIFGVKLAVIILGVVFVVAILLQGVIGSLVSLDQWWAKRSAPAEEAPAEADEALSPEMVAAISAAVTVALDKRVRIKRIRYRRGGVGTTWVVQGRATLLASHRVKS